MHSRAEVKRSEVFQIQVGMMLLLDALSNLLS